MFAFRFCVQYAIVLALLGCSPSSPAKSLEIPHPDKLAARIEFFEERPAGNGPWPAVVFLHGHQNPMNRIGGEAFVKWGVLTRFAKAGYLAVSISLPGYGRSNGPEDFAGPFTQHAVAAVIAKLKADGSAVPDRILIQGTSLGAVTAALVAAEDKELAGLVLISGVYDLQSFFAQSRSVGALGVRAVAAAQTGGTIEALRERSALPLASQIRARTLILNGARDDRTDPDQAKRFAAAIGASGGQAKVHIFPEAGHEIPVEGRDAEISAFIDATLRR